MRDGKWSKCCNCDADMWVPADLDAAASRARGRISMYCAYGHGQVYSVGEPEADKLRRERDRLTQQLAQRDDEIASQRRRAEEAEREATKQRGQVVRMKKRAAAGVCPCCHRTFSELQRHMKTKHPIYAAENIVPFKAEAVA